MYKTKIGIIGLGKIGFKIAISLLECGNNIEIYTRDYEALYKKCTCMDLIKPESTYARPIPHRSLEACIHLKDIIILATTSQNIINEKLVSIIKPNSVIYSIGHGEERRDRTDLPDVILRKAFSPQRSVILLGDFLRGP